MKRICVFVLSAISYTSAQTLQPPWSWSTATPAQRDWVDAVISESAPLPPHTETALSSQSSVSVVRLQHKPPRKAIKLFQRGMNLATAGQYEKGVAEFQRAAAIDPQFSEAYGNIGASLSHLGQFDEAVVNFQRAIHLDPATGTHHMNLAYALFHLDRAKEAETEARTAVALEPTSEKAQYLLGVLLAQRAESRELAIEHLAYAGHKLPEAHYILSQLYRLDGNAHAADRELQLYQQKSGDQEKGAR